MYVSLNTSPPWYTVLPSDNVTPQELRSRGNGYYDPIPGQEIVAPARSAHKRAILHAVGARVTNDTVQVGNLHQEVDNFALKNAMATFGEVLEATVDFDYQTGVSRCKGSVNFITLLLAYDVESHFCML